MPKRPQTPPHTPLAARIHYPRITTYCGTRVGALARRARIGLPGVATIGDGELGLTPREREVLELVAQGLTNWVIGERLYIAETTASVHISNILAKLEVSNRGEAAALAHRLGLTSPD